MIMAGGEGTRLRPLTANQPKPMLAMANRPMMEHVIDLVRRHGFDDIVVTVAFMGNAIRNYFGDGAELGVKITYSVEEHPLGTAGSVLNARDQLSERFLVISGDVLTDIDLSALVAFHESRGALATIALKSVDNPLEFGIVIAREDGSIERFLEKPSWGEVFSDTVNTGIYVLEPRVLDFIEQGVATDFSNDVFPALLGAGEPIYAFVGDGYWEDVGTVDAYLRAHRDILNQKVKVNISGFSLRDGVWLGEGAEVDPSARIDGPALIGDNAAIGRGAHLSEYSVVGPNVKIGSEVFVERSVVHERSYLGAGVRLRSTVIGRSSTLRQGARCEEGVVLGEECVVGAHAVVKTGVKIYPFKTVDSGAIVNSSIVWESRGARSLFGPIGVAGLANVDITPELAVRLSMAYASTLGKGAVVSASRDTSKAARVLKRAVMVGCNTVGVNVDDLEVATVPVTRYQVRAGRSQGGVTVTLSPEDPESVLLRFLDAHGLDMDPATQRKVERIYNREDFRRSRAVDIGDIGFPSRVLESYTADLIASIDAASVGDAHFKVVLDYAFGAASFVMPNVLAKLGAEVLALNPYAATALAVGFDRAGRAGEVSELVRASGAHLGVVIDPVGEQLTIVDDTGRVLDDNEALLLFTHLVTTVNKGARLALPVSASRHAQELCADHGAHIVWTKMSTANLLEVAGSAGVDLACDQTGCFAFPRFIPAVDAVAAFVHLVAWLAETGTSLSKIASGLPRVHINHQSVATPWEQKGMVMRTMLESVASEDVVLVDGVKVLEEDGWALIVPDPQEPWTHVWAEGQSDVEARARAHEYTVRIRRVLH